MFYVNHIPDNLNKEQLNDKRVKVPFTTGRHYNHFITKNVECIHRQLAGTGMMIKAFKLFGMMFRQQKFIIIDFTKSKKNSNTILNLDFFLFQRAIHSSKISKFGSAKSNF